MLTQFYRAFRLAYPEIWGRVTRDCTPAERAGLSPLPGRVADRCNHFLRLRLHTETRSRGRDWLQDNGVRFEFLQPDA